MRSLCLQFLLAFAVLCAGVHAPAQAHDLPGEHGDMVAELSQGHQDFAGDHNGQHNSTEGSQELFHHHHCPMALTLDTSEKTADGFTSRQVHRPATVAALLSRATAPPTEPPLA